MEYSTFGRHVAMDVWGVKYDRLNNAEWLQTQMVQADRKSTRLNSSH